ncbi:hypothetical protein [Pseudomonas putida]|uniref:Uncharacterized protein n=1 Tax=Pseudomonas putida TaxID=303 RepID=A0A6I6XPG2_PSEPU|nr:hypothetical protein [Pseudomonas putida]QHG67592.1 hypothetical protein C2H86_25565 [Pseudomonas putida]
MNALERPLPRSDAWAANASHSTVRYRLQAEAEPDTLCRVLNLFALQSLTPHSVQVSQQEGGAKSRNPLPNLVPAGRASLDPGLPQGTDAADVHSQ